MINDPRRGVAYVPFKINPYFRSAQVSRASFASNFESFKTRAMSIIRVPYCLPKAVVICYVVRIGRLGYTWATASATSSRISQ